MMVAREGLKIILPAFVLAFILLIAGIYFEKSILIICFWLAFAFFLFSLGFFRDPERVIPTGENLIISPADGKVVAICPENDEFVGKATRVSIFMSIFNVHVNRIPLSGTVRSIDYSKGRFLPAMKPETSFENERNTIGLESGKIKLKFTQVAGIMARRIVSYLKVNDQVKTGQRFGLIMFGSRVDLLVPETVNLKVKIGDKVTAGYSVIGEFE
jgi:phosphatidylserine decarboxylase